MGVPRVTVLAPELTPAIRVDAVGEPPQPLRHGLIQDAAHLERPEFDQVALIGVFCCSRHACNADERLIKNREERRA